MFQGGYVDFILGRFCFYCSRRLPWTWLNFTSSCQQLCEQLFHVNKLGLHKNLFPWISLFDAWKKKNNILPNGGAKWRWITMVKSKKNTCNQIQEPEALWILLKKNEGTLWLSFSQSSSKLWNFLPSDIFRWSMLNQRKTNISRHRVDVYFFHNHYGVHDVVKTHPRSFGMLECENSKHFTILLLNPQWCTLW